MYFFSFPLQELLLGHPPERGGGPPPLPRVGRQGVPQPDRGRERHGRALPTGLRGGPLGSVPGVREPHAGGRKVDSAHRLEVHAARRQTGAVFFCLLEN